MRAAAWLAVSLIALTSCSVAGAGSTTTEATTTTTAPPRSTTSVPTPPTTLAPVPTSTIPSGVAVETVAFTDSLELEVYYPQTPGPWPVLVAEHGGGWEFGNREAMAPLAAAIAGEGAVVFNATYRTLLFGGGFPETFEDVACAVRFARERAPEYGGEPGRITLLGHSAGAHLAMVIALAGDTFSGDCRVTDGSATPDAFVGLAGPYAVRSMAALPSLQRLFGGTPETATTAWEAGDPYALVGLNPTLTVRLIHGAVDPLVPAAMSHELAGALEDAGYDVSLTIVPGAGHTDVRDPTFPDLPTVEVVVEVLGD